MATSPDVSGNGHDANLSAGSPDVAVSTDVPTNSFGTSLEFTPSSYADCGALSEIGGLTTMSIATWIKFESIATGAARAAFSHGSFTTDDGWVIGARIVSSGFITLYFDQGLSFDPLGRYDITDDTWVHTVLLYDGGGATSADKIKWYEDGVQQTVVFAPGDPTIPSTLPSTDKNFLMGFATGLSNYMTGHLFDTRVYSDLLTADEITYLANAPIGNGGGVAPDTADLEAHWAPATIPPVPPIMPALIPLSVPDQRSRTQKAVSYRT